jgi:hypothetical protein
LVLLRSVRFSGVYGSALLPVTESCRCLCAARFSCAASAGAVTLLPYPHGRHDIVYGKTKESKNSLSIYWRCVA